MINKAFSLKERHLAYLCKGLNNSVFIRLDGEWFCTTQRGDRASRSRDYVSQADNDNLNMLLISPVCNCKGRLYTGMCPKPETARATLTMLIWLAGPWQLRDFAVSSSMASVTICGDIAAGIMSVVNPNDSLGAVCKRGCVKRRIEVV